VAPAGIRWANKLPDWLWPLALAGLLALAWAVVYLAGGTQTAWPHLFYLPIVLATLPYRLRGGLVVALAATLLCGPLMPLDVAAGQTQEVTNWLARGVFFVAVGLLAGATADTLHRSVRDRVSDHLRSEIDRASAPETPPDAAGEERLRRVLEQRRFHPVFQPILTLADGALIAVEALTRFDAEPQRSPDVWFDEAAMMGVGVELELAAITVALEATAGLPADVALHLNASPATVGSDRLLELLDGHHGRRVVVEVTERTVVDDYPALKRARERLRAHGVGLAIDDTGAGFASLRHVVRLEPDVLKLDMSLVHEVASNPVSEALAEALIRFAQATDTMLVAEGIEDDADLAAWRELGAQAGQGYHLGRPGPLTTWLPQARPVPAPPAPEARGA